MNGFQVTFFSEQGRRQGHHAVDKWLIEIAQSLGIGGVTVAAGVEGRGRDGKLHSAHFVELADQPIEITMAVTDEQSQKLFQRLEQEKASLFYVKSPVEFGVVGNATPEESHSLSVAS